MFLAGHWCGTWLSSHIFQDGQDLLQCALVGYYLLLFDLMETGGSGGYFHPITVKNLLPSVGTLWKGWPIGRTARHFGRRRQQKMLVNTILNAPRMDIACPPIFSTQCLHLQQSRNIQSPNEKKLLSWMEGPERRGGHIRRPASLANSVPLQVHRLRGTQRA